MSRRLNLLERVALIASAVTLLCGQVFQASTSSGAVFTLLTVLVLTILVCNALIIAAVVYMEWSPAVDDAQKQFDDLAMIEKVLFIFCTFYL